MFDKAYIIKIVKIFMGKMPIDFEGLDNLVQYPQSMAISPAPCFTIVEAPW